MATNLNLKSPNMFCHWILQGKKCFYCEVHLTADNCTKDHFIPRSKGGGTSWKNFVLACSGCNSKKGNRWPTIEEFAKFDNLKREVPSSQKKCHRFLKKYKARSGGVY